MNGAKRSESAWDGRLSLPVGLSLVNLPAVSGSELADRRTVYERPVLARTLEKGRKQDASVLVLGCLRGNSRPSGDAAEGTLRTCRAVA